VTRSTPFLVLGIGVAIVSTASILVRYAQANEASSASIAAGRLTIAALIMAPIALSRAGPELLRLRRKDLLLCAASGLLLAAHFWTWIASLEYTSVANSTVLVTTNPVWVALLSAWLLREKPAYAQLVGVALTFAGTLLIFFAESSHSGQAASPMLGNFLALIGALAASGYLLIGRNLRSSLSLLSYVWLTYSFAAMGLIVAALAGGNTIQEISFNAWLMIAALAVGPQLLGHTAFNWALRRVTATFVAVTILGEPIGSALLAWWLLDEGFVPLQLAGFVVLLWGILVAAKAERIGISKTLTAEHTEDAARNAENQNTHRGGR
jgi:drug/metabolite transporter (DMT)-like permease